MVIAMSLQIFQKVKQGFLTIILGLQVTNLKIIKCKFIPENCFKIGLGYVLIHYFVIMSLSCFI